MEGRKGILWHLLSGAMELSWFFAWAMFSAIATLHRPFPFFETIIAFALAGFITHISAGNGAVGLVSPQHIRHARTGLD
ncbi:MAG: hypothetical protein L7F78_26600, partial [Syntrophales bacterium LBB04]|nr:hypothetical protein [Syntrophales bacterium LBB04]